MSNNPTARALDLLSLLQTHRWWHGGELATRLAITERTLRRDVDRLRELGYPVEAIPGRHGGYRLAAGTHMPPPLLDDDEAVAVAVGLRYSASGAIAGMEETSLRAAAKIESLLPHRLRRRVSAMYSNVSTLQSAGSDGIVERESLIAIAAACRDNEELRFVYVRHDRDEAQRLVQPHQLVTAGRRWYLVAWDRERDDWRTFRVDRLAGVRPTGRRFSPREIPGGDAAAHVAQSLAAMPREHTARLSIAAPFSALEGSFYWVDHELVESRDERCIVEVRAEDRGRLLMTIARLGLIAPVTVREPAEVADHVARLTCNLTSERVALTRNGKVTAAPGSERETTSGSRGSTR